MSRNVSIVKKFLMSQPFFEDGFEYQFISVEPDSDWAIKFTVNVLLPKKGQSFVVEKFSYDIGTIIENASRYIGEGVSYTENILIEGKPIPENGMYINPEDCDEIISSSPISASRTLLCPVDAMSNQWPSNLCSNVENLNNLQMNSE